MTTIIYTVLAHPDNVPAVPVIVSMSGRQAEMVARRTYEALTGAWPQHDVIHERNGVTSFVERDTVRVQLVRGTLQDMGYANMLLNLWEADNDSA